MSTQAVSFWEGVLVTLKDAYRLKTFQELEYFREFLSFAETSLRTEEKIYKKCIDEQKTAKKTILDYSCQVGKMKGLDFAG